MSKEEQQLQRTIEESIRASYRPLYSLPPVERQNFIATARVKISALEETKSEEADAASEESANIGSTSFEYSEDEEAALTRD